MPQFQYRDPTKAAREALNSYASMMNKRQKQADEQARLALADKRYQQQQDWQNKQWEHKLDREQTADARLDAKQAQDSYTNSLVAKMYGAKDTNELASTMKEISKNGGYNSNTIGSTYRQLHKDLQAKQDKSNEKFNNSKASLETLTASMRPEQYFANEDSAKKIINNFSYSPETSKKLDEIYKLKANNVVLSKDQQNMYNKNEDMIGSMNKVFAPSTTGQAIDNIYAGLGYNKDGTIDYSGTDKYAVKGAENLFTLDNTRTIDKNNRISALQKQLSTQIATETKAFNKDTTSRLNKAAINKTKLTKYVDKFEGIPKGSRLAINKAIADGSITDANQLSSVLIAATQDKSWLKGLVGKDMKITNSGVTSALKKYKGSSSEMYKDIMAKISPTVETDAVKNLKEQLAAAKGTDYKVADDILKQAKGLGTVSTSKIKPITKDIIVNQKDAIDKYINGKNPDVTSLQGLLSANDNEVSKDQKIKIKSRLAKLGKKNTTTLSEYDKTIKDIKAELKQLPTITSEDFGYNPKSSQKILVKRKELEAKLNSTEQDKKNAALQSVTDIRKSITSKAIDRTNSSIKTKLNEIQKLKEEIAKKRSNENDMNVDKKEYRKLYSKLRNTEKEVQQLQKVELPRLQRDKNKLNSNTKIPATADIQPTINTIVPNDVTATKPSVNSNIQELVSDDNAKPIINTTNKDPKEFVLGPSNMFDDVRYDPSKLQFAKPVVDTTSKDLNNVDQHYADMADNILKNSGKQNVTKETRQALIDSLIEKDLDKKLYKYDENGHAPYTEPTVGPDGKIIQGDAFTQEANRTISDPIRIAEVKQYNSLKRLVDSGYDKGMIVSPDGTRQIDATELTDKELAHYKKIGYSPISKWVETNKYIINK